MTETVLETERLRLRKIDVTDAAFILSLLTDPTFERYIGDKGVKNLDQAREYILTGPVASYRRFGFGLYLVELVADATAIGVCGLLKRSTLDDVDLGYALLPEFWSHGYAREAAAAVLAYGIEELALPRIVAVTASANQSSIKVLQRVGMVFEAMIRLPDETVEKMLFATAAMNSAAASR